MKDRGKWVWHLSTSHGDPEDRVLYREGEDDVDDALISVSEWSNGNEADLAALCDHLNLTEFVAPSEKK